jgi:hypothetical protein
MSDYTDPEIVTKKIFATKNNELHKTGLFKKIQKEMEKVG